jgi:hypothetical protein
MTTRIHWTENERELVVERALELVHQHDLSFYDALRQAQVRLPTHRQRSFTTYSSATAEIKLLRTRHAAYEASMAKKVVPPTVVDSVPPAPPVPSPVPQPELTLDELVQAIATKVAVMLTESIKREIKELEHTFQLQKHNPSYASSGTPTPHIAVIGLLPGQAHQIEREFGDRFALKFIRSEDAKHAAIPYAQAYLLMKNFIDHSVFHKYQPFPQHVLIDGGMSALRMWFNTKGVEL